jgi:hypothetical protein
MHIAEKDKPRIIGIVEIQIFHLDIFRRQLFKLKLLSTQSAFPHTDKQGDLQTTQKPLFLPLRHSPNNNSPIFKQKYIRNPLFIMFIIIRLLPSSSI